MIHVIDVMVLYYIHCFMVLADKDVCSSLSREDLKLAGEKVRKLIGLPGVNQRSSALNL